MKTLNRSRGRESALTFFENEGRRRPAAAPTQ